VPRAAVDRISEVVREEWGRELIRSWKNSGWMELPVTLGDKIARLVRAVQRRSRCVQLDFS
jgi:kynureninase